jgi:hypothetical protein
VSSARVFAAFLTARAVYGLAFLGASAGRWLLPWYYPLEHRWAIEARPEGFAMGWFGTTALALAAAAIGASLVWIASARGALGKALARPSAVTSIAHAGALVLLVDFAYFGWTLTHQTPAPLPLPAWYCPR